MAVSGQLIPRQSPREKYSLVNNRQGQSPPGKSSPKTLTSRGYLSPVDNYPLRHLPKDKISCAISQPIQIQTENNVQYSKINNGKGAQIRTYLRVLTYFLVRTKIVYEQKSLTHPCTRILKD